MADGVALAPPLSIPAPLPNWVSANLRNASLAAVPGTLAFTLIAGAGVSSAAAVGTPTPTGGTAAGVHAPAHDGQWFERIHVLPREKDIEFVLSDQAFTAEVWNAHRYQARQLTAITVVGPAGLEVANPDGALPAAFPPSRSVLYTVTARQQGDAQIGNLVTWSFNGVPTLGTTLVVTGVRLLVFPIEPNWDEDLVERYGYLTNLLVADDENEQRVQLREVPRRELEYSILCTDPQDAQLANALLYGWAGQAFGVPHWGYNLPLSSPVSVDGTTIVVATTDVPWAAGGLVMLWKNPRTYEVLTIDTVGAGSLTTTTGAKLSWATADTRVLPVFVARATETPFTWLARDFGATRLTFDVDAVEVPTPAAPAETLYAGFGLLSIEPSAEGDVLERVERGFTLVDPGTGARYADVRAKQSHPTRGFVWRCHSRAEVAQLRAFLDARRGRAVPFWLPSWQRDLSLAADVASGSSALTIQRVGYTTLMFANGPGRRHLRIWGPGLTTAHRKVTAATDPGVAVENLTIDAGVPAMSYPAATALLSFLKLCRLEEDLVEIRWEAPQVAVAELAVREIPTEAPL